MAVRRYCVSVVSDIGCGGGEEHETNSIAAEIWSKAQSGPCPFRETCETC